MTRKINETIYDKRVIDLHVKKGLMTNKDYEEFLKSLPDDSKNADTLKVFQEEENLLTFSSVHHK